MYSDKTDLLTKAKDLLKEEMTNISYTTWIKSLEIQSVNDNKIVLVALSEIQKDAIESRLFDLVVNTFNFITNKTCEITIVVKSEEKDREYSQEENNQDFISSEAYSNSFLNPKYTFDTFVIGNNNKFAQAAAYAVAEAPATAYNPLFIYGGVGLGKTHLMHAIGNQILRNNPNTKILYVTSEQFINELVNSIKDANFKNELFRNKYRNIDVLLIDDIQFIAGKKMGQEEFFHTFNTLYQSGKQIIISSDKPPRDIPLLEERLKSRFEWGILADISMPDYETRLAILRKKVQLENIIIEDYILSVIATKIDTNIPYTVLRYCMEVIRSWKKSNKMNKNAIYPVIIPIIIYSGKEEWNIFMNFKRVETKLTTFEKNKVELGYNFIALNKMLKSSVLYNCNTIQKLVLIESIKTI